MFAWEEIPFKDIVNKIIIKNQRFSEIILLQLLLQNWIHFRFIRTRVYTNYHSSPGVAGWLPSFFMDTRLRKFRMRLRKTFSYAYIRHLNAELSLPVIPFSFPTPLQLPHNRNNVAVLFSSYLSMACHNVGILPSPSLNSLRVNSFLLG